MLSPLILASEINLPSRSRNILVVHLLNLKKASNNYHLVINLSKSRTNTLEKIEPNFIKEKEEFVLTSM